jgi:tetratricopeptide (TPR) repeat protein
MSVEDRIERVRVAYERAVYDGDTELLGAAERGLDAVEAELANARGRVLHARFLAARAEGGGSAPVEDPAELPSFERAAELCRALGDERGEGDALFWIGCVHQVIRRDNEAAVPAFERARELAVRAGDQRTQGEALRHLGIAAHMSGRLDEAREWLEESSRVRREIGALAGVAANMVGLAYIAAAQGRRAAALGTLDEAQAIALAHGAQSIVRQVEEARAGI